MKQEIFSFIKVTRNRDTAWEFTLSVGEVKPNRLKLIKSGDIAAKQIINVMVTRKFMIVSILFYQSDLLYISGQK